MSVKKTRWFNDGPIPFRILGEDIQEVEFVMLPGQRLVLEPDTFVCAAGGVRGLGITFGRRLLDPIYRQWAGEAAILQEIICEGEPARVVLGAPQIGRMVRLRVRPEQPVICQRGAFVASTGDIDIGIAFTRKVRAGLFGGQGIVFQRLSGSGDVFLHAEGTINDWWVPRGRIVRVSTNNILAFESSVGYDVQLSGGALTILFGGQGFFLSQLEGPGRVITQSINHNALARALGHKRGAVQKSTPTADGR